MSSVLLSQLDSDQLLLLRETFQPFEERGEWPVWDYVERRLDAEGLTAVDVLASLPVVGGPGGMRYGLTWSQDGRLLPNLGTQLTLTVAGLWQLGSAAASLLVAFKDTLRFLIERQRTVVPNPFEVVEAKVTSQELADALAGGGEGNFLGPAAAVTLRKTGMLVEHEPYLWHGFGRPELKSERWELAIPASIREFRDVTSIEEYVERVEQLIVPPEPPSQPLSSTPLEIPYAVSFLDAVWENKTGYPLFARPEPASIARLTQPCDDEGSFNSHMSALADVLSQVKKPGVGKAPRAGGLEMIAKYLDERLDSAAAARCSDAIGTLTKLRTIRHGIEHGDARAKAVAAYADVGLAFPVQNWTEAWAHVAAITCGALDALREEIHAGLGRV